VVVIVIAVSVTVTVSVMAAVVIAVLIAPFPIFALFPLFAALVFHVLVVTFAFPLRVVRRLGGTVGPDVYTPTIGATDHERNYQYRAEERADGFLHVRTSSIYLRTNG